MERLLLLPAALVLYLLLLALGVMSLCWNLFAMLAYPVLDRDTGLRIGRAGIYHVYRLFWQIAAFTGLLRLDVQGLDDLRNEPGIVIVANHPTMLDALILVSRLPRSACIMKAQLMRNIFLGAGSRLARYIRNDSPRSMIRLAVNDLKAGGQLIMFPEGTRTTHQPLNRFRPGVTLIAKLAEAPIQTVFIHTDTPYLTKGWPLWRLPPLPIVFSVRPGERFAPDPDSEALLARLEQYFIAGVKPRSPASSQPRGTTSAAS